MPRRVSPYGSAVDAEYAGLARSRPGAAAEAGRELGSTMTARDVARQAANRNYDKAGSTFADLTTSCNRCHQTFQVPVRVGPAEEERKQ